MTYVISLLEQEVRILEEKYAYSRRMTQKREEVRQAIKILKAAEEEAQDQEWLNRRNW